MLVVVHLKSYESDGAGILYAQKDVGEGTNLHKRVAVRVPYSVRT